MFSENFCRSLMPLCAFIAAVHRQFFPVAYSVIPTHLKLETDSSLFPSLHLLSSSGVLPLLNIINFVFLFLMDMMLSSSQAAKLSMRIAKIHLTSVCRLSVYSILYRTPLTIWMKLWEIVSCRNGDWFRNHAYCRMDGFRVWGRSNCSLRTSHSSKVPDPPLSFASRNLKEARPFSCALGFL
jgi:hypothetical protein